jgi:phage shock protein A
MVAQKKGRAPEGVNEWLERELRETRSRLHKVESELEQSLKRTWTLESDVKRLSDAATQTASASSVVAGLREEVRQVRDLISRLQERQAAIAGRAEEALRLRSAGDGRDKHDFGSVTKRIDAVARSVEPYENRIQVIEETVRRAEEHVAGARLTAATLDRIVEEAGTRANRALEAAARLEQTVSTNIGDIEALRKTDDALGERVKVILEQVHRFTDRVDRLESVSKFQEEAKELIARGASDRDLMAQRIALVEKLAGELAERTQNLGHSLAKVEARQQVQNAQVVDLSGQVHETAEQLLGQLKRFNQLLLRQRRRQLDTLAAEVKELGHGEPRAQE